MLWLARPRSPAIHWSKVGDIIWTPWPKNEDHQENMASVPRTSQNGHLAEKSNHHRLQGGEEVSSFCVLYLMLTWAITSKSSSCTLPHTLHPITHQILLICLLDSFIHTQTPSTTCTSFLPVILHFNLILLKSKIYCPHYLE